MDRKLFIAWQDKANRGWYPVGMLEADVVESIYRFRYIRGAEREHRAAGFEPLVSFPDLQCSYESAELFPFFMNRLLQPNRQEYKDWLEMLSLENPDPIEILALTEGGRQTDNLEMFPKIKREPDGSFRCRFFLHGSRHVNAPAQERIKLLKVGDLLGVSVKTNNPATKVALQIQTGEDYHVIGWAPRYLLTDLIKAMSEDAFEITATVIRINPENTPVKNRVLIEFLGRCPTGFEPMATEYYLPLVQ